MRTHSSIAIAMLSFTFALAACAPALPASAGTTPTPTFAAAKFGGTDKDVTYCTPKGLPQKLDLYYPTSGGPWPALVYVHGGSWAEGDKAEGEGWRYLNEQGILVVSVNYRMAAYNIKFPAMIEDVKCAVRFLRAHAAEYNLDPARIGAVGASSGGHLVALLGTADASAGWDGGEYADQSSRVQAVAALSGIMDFTLKLPDGLTNIIYFAFDDLPGTSKTMAAASPVTWVSDDDPPFLILAGDRDGVVPMEQSRSLYDRLTAAGAPAELVNVQNGDHQLQGMGGNPTVPTSAEISAIIDAFFMKHLLGAKE